MEPSIIYSEELTIYEGKPTENNPYPTSFYLVIDIHNNETLNIFVTDDIFLFTYIQISETNQEVIK